MILYPMLYEVKPISSSSLKMEECNISHSRGKYTSKTMKYTPFHLRGKGNEFRDSERKEMGSTLPTSTTETSQKNNPSPALP